MKNLGHLVSLLVDDKFLIYSAEVIKVGGIQGPFDLRQSNRVGGHRSWGWRPSLLGWVGGHRF